MKKIIVACDSFKGSLSSIEIADEVEKGIKKVLPGCEVVKLPLADGGEGMLEAFIYNKKAEIQHCLVHDALMNEIPADYAILEDGKTAVIEMAAASGLTLIPEDKRNPMLTTTYGTGELIRHAIEKGCRHFIIGVGGSATNDAGTGMLEALGFKFLDKQGNELGKGGNILEYINEVDTSAVIPAVRDASFIIVSDVNNPFYGQRGAAYVFAKQKGATDFMIGKLDYGLKHFADFVYAKYGKDINNIPGSGAGGGIAGGFLAFLNAEIKEGIEVILQELDFDNYIQHADLIITGEGKMDAQTLHGKAPAGILKIAQKHNMPVIALSGWVEEVERLNDAGFTAVFSIQPYPVSLDKAMDKEFAKENIRRLVSQIIRVMSCPQSALSGS